MKLQTNKLCLFLFLGDLSFFVATLLKVLQFCLTALAYNYVTQVPQLLCVPAGPGGKTTSCNTWRAGVFGSQILHLTCSPPEYASNNAAPLVRGYIPQLFGSINPQGHAIVTYIEKGYENDENKCQVKQEFSFGLSSQNIWSPIVFMNHLYIAADVNQS